MKSNQNTIHSVPTNIITGFLGVGKTSAILHLLENKPQDERWAVLVNEFGEVGVDGSLFEGQYNEEQSVFIREVPGGCMCCAAGLPMQIALNQLLTKARPDRLLIEPTGLGHPFEVLEVLTSENYHNVLSLQKTITLVDARKLDNERYRVHDTFRQQIALADIIVGNKQDLYKRGDKDRLTAFVKEYGSPNSPEITSNIIFTEMGKFPFDLLAGETHAVTKSPCEHSHSDHSHDGHHHDHGHSEPQLLASDMAIPESGYLKASNEGEGFQSVGWRFSSSQVFDRIKVESFIGGICAERVKAVFITDNGVFGYNATSDVLTEIEMDESIESRIEIIASTTQEQWHEELMNCRLSG